MKTGVELIADERQRQIKEEGWTALHDDVQHDKNELALAAVCYAMPDHVKPIEDSNTVFISVKRYAFWPWNWRWWKPTPDDRIKELVKAGALIAAEIDRLQRLK